MNAGYYLSLYGRNALGVIVNGFVFGMGLSFLAIPFWLCALALLPLTLTFGAGIKTIIDCYNRNYTLDANAINAMPDLINGMSEEKISKLRDQASLQEKHCASLSRSNSSARLIEKLSAYKKQQVEEGSIEIQKKRIELALQQLHPDVPRNELHSRLSMYKDGVLASLELEGKYQLELSQFKVQASELPCSRRLKSDIASYMAEEKNNGKKLFQLIIAFFSPEYAQPQINHDGTESDRLMINASRSA